MCNIRFPVAVIALSMMPQSSQDPIFSLRSLTCDCIIPAVAIAVDDEKSQSCQLVLTVKWEKGNGSYLALCTTGLFIASVTFDTPLIS